MINLQIHPHSLSYFDLTHLLTDQVTHLASWGAP